jgi:predicted short-subunit dehydrogenase-like oxidoreductase (DUF2520 family)
MQPTESPSPQDSPLQVIIVGPGRLGRTVAHRLRELGQDVQLIGRGQPVPAGPLTWLTVPDRSIAAVAATVPAGGVLLHASGAAGLEVLGTRPGRGSLHPLMTFPGPELAPLRAGEVVPAAVAGDAPAQAAARRLAVALGFTPFAVPGDRRAYHAAAVMAGNFATTLLGLASRIMVEAGVPADEAPALLAPLALQSLKNAALRGPTAALTGPVVRGDDAVIESHLDVMAQRCPSILPAYRALVAATRELLTEPPAATPTPRLPDSSPARLPDPDSNGK